mmetsp:Transcript_8836/g.12568  ORF Transcript_8836/g.12568 Transcript_8836/m.12568 type:complete len:292 (+) Transcript_8836:169-1044(+)
MPRSELVQHICKKKWDSVIARVALYPEEATMSTHQTHGPGCHIVRSLPIHLICKRKPPLRVLLALMVASVRSVADKDGLGQLPLHNAVHYGASTKVVEVLLAIYPVGASIAADDGSTPLHLACLYGTEPSVIKSLVSANVHAMRCKDCHGLTPKEVVMDNPNIDARSTFLGLLEKADFEHFCVQGIGCFTDRANTLLTSKESFYEDEDDDKSSTVLPTIPADIRKRRSSSKMCVICLENDVNVVLLPCGHPCLCSECSNVTGLERIDWKCPLCRSRISEAANFFGRVVNDE